MNSRIAMRSLFVPGLLLLLGHAAWGTAAWAQRPARYFPMNAPLSPYLYYSAINTTGLPNYYTYIRPTQQFQAFLERRTVDTQRLESRIRLDETRVGEIVARQLELRQTTGLGAPATPGTFMDYSHYFARPTTPRRPN